MRGLNWFSFGSMPVIEVRCVVVDKTLALVAELACSPFLLDFKEYEGSMVYYGDGGFRQSCYSTFLRELGQGEGVEFRIANRSGTEASFVLTLIGRASARLLRVCASWRMQGARLVIFAYRFCLASNIANDSVSCCASYFHKEYLTSILPRRWTCLQSTLEHGSSAATARRERGALLDYTACWTWKAATATRCMKC